jgi:hypothetical protein
VSLEGTVVIEVTPDGRLSKNGLRKSNWRTSQRLMKKAREDGYVLGLAERPADWVTPDKARVYITHKYARRPLDFDGLACIAAPYIDGLVDAGILEDDDPSHITGYYLLHGKVKTMAECCVRIMVVAWDNLVQLE